MRILITGLILFLAWAGLSSWFYVCQIKGLCSGDMETELISVPEPSGEESLITGELPTAASVKEPAVCTIYFSLDQSAMEPDPVLQSDRDHYKAWTVNYPDAVVQIIGHTDATGSDEYNLELGRKRAETVRNFFVAGGIPDDRIIIITRGESEPVADNRTSEGRAKNRRAVVSLKK